MNHRRGPANPANNRLCISWVRKYKILVEAIQFPSLGRKPICGVIGKALIGAFVNDSYPSIHAEKGAS